MSMHALFLYNAAALIIIGVFGILTRRNIIKILLAINILQTGVNLLLVAVGWRPDGLAPIITDQTRGMMQFVDPLPQAMVLTAIVIAFGTTALGLIIAINYFKTHRSLETRSFLFEQLKTDEDEVVQ
jgi:NADH-quinone oxidoreductase subunit K/multicomponent Na+:H+ antiporter subunit C